MKKIYLVFLALLVIAAVVIVYGLITERRPDATIVQLERFIEESPHEISLAYYDFANEEMQEINGNKELFPASMIKVLFLLAALEKIEQGDLSLDETYTLKEEDKYMNDSPVTGSGTMQNEEPGKEFTVEEILHLMVSISDNIASNITFDLVGESSITNMANRMGLTNTSAQQKMFEAPDGTPRNTSTAVDLTKMLIALENSTAVNKELSKKGIDMMKDTVDKNRIGLNLDEKLTLANKIGTASSMIGDMGIIYFPSRPPLALTIMVEEPQDQMKADEEIGQLTKIILDSVAN